MMALPDGSAKILISAQYFVYFGVLGIFLPYFNLYCHHLDFSGFQIGLLAAARSLTLVFLPLIWAMLADHYGLRRIIFIGCNLMSAVIWLGYLYTTDFALMLSITVMYGIFHAPIISFLEAFTMDILGRAKKSYGRVRVWGSLSFIVTVLVFGWIIDLYSVEVILPAVFIGSALHAVLTLKMPAPPHRARETFLRKIKLLIERRILIFLFSALLMIVSHGTYYGFFSIHLENLGFDSTFIGICWALASIAEILIMVNSDRIFSKFSLEQVLVLSFAIAAVRWLILSYARSAQIILLAQTLHAFTYGAFHIASILFIDRLMPKAAKTLGQAVNNAGTYGLGMMLGVFLSGVFFEQVGAPVLFAACSLLAVCGGLLVRCFLFADSSR